MTTVQPLLRIKPDKLRTKQTTVSDFDATRLVETTMVCSYILTTQRGFMVDLEFFDAPDHLEAQVLTTLPHRRGVKHGSDSLGVALAGPLAGEVETGFCNLKPSI